MAYSIESTSDDCYPGTTVLMNKLGIKNQAQLDESETLIVGVKSMQFELNPFSEELDFAYYKRLHAFLFGELYDWAGKIRHINMSKQHTHFCSPAEIESLGQEMFTRLHQMQFFAGFPKAAFVRELADFYSSVNYLHPFREGNGRTQRLFFRQLALHVGYQINFAGIDSDSMMIATIHAASGIEDDLIKIFNVIVKEVDSQ